MFPCLCIFRAAVAKASNLAGYPHIKSANTHWGKAASLKCPATCVDMHGSSFATPCAFFVRAVCVAEGCEVTSCCLFHTCDAGEGDAGANGKACGTRNSSIPLCVYTEFARFLAAQERGSRRKLTARSLVAHAVRVGLNPSVSLSVAGRALRAARKKNPIHVHIGTKW